MQQRSTVFRNGSWLQGPKLNLIKESSVRFNSHFTDAPASEEDIVFDCSGYLLVPGLINAATESQDTLALQKQGYTTICFVKGEIATLDSEDGKKEYAVTQSGNYGYQLSRDSQSVNVQTVDYNPSNDVLFGTGNPKKYSASIWRQWQLRLLQEKVKPSFLFSQATYKAAKQLGLSNVGLIDVGYSADFLVIPIQPEWQLDSADTLLESVLFFGSPDLIAAVYKNGQLVYAQDQFADKFQLASLEYYYSHDNLPLNKTVKSSNFDTIEDAIAAFGRGEFVIAVDNEDRENEGDLIIPAQDLTPEKAAFMIRYTSGVICAPATGEILDRLQIPLMVLDNQDTLKTAYTVSVDAKGQTTTGISARDRSTTVQMLANNQSQPGDFSRPGHVFPLRAVPGGVLKRVGHTEASVDLCILAGKAPVAAICEIVLDDGRMARRDDLVLFARKHRLCLITIDDLVKYRLEHNL